MVLPAVLYQQIDLDDANIIASLDQIRIGCQVYVDTSAACENIISIRGDDKRDIAQAIRRIHKLLNTEEPGWHPTYLIQPSSVSVEHLAVKLEKTAEDRARHVYIQPSQEYKFLAVNAVNKTKYTHDFQTAFRKIVEYLRSKPNEMRMRVQFGHVELTSWRKDKNEMTYTEFEKLTKQVGRRGCAVLNQKVGSEGFCNLLLEKLRQPDSVYRPAIIQDVSSVGFKPKNFLVLFIRGLILEIEIQNVGSPNGVVAQLSSARAMNTGQGIRKIEITSVCPLRLVLLCFDRKTATNNLKSRSHDWKLEVLTETGLTDLPLLIQNIKNHIILGPIKTAEDYPQPQLTSAAIRAGVEGVAGRTSWGFGSADPSYQMDVSIYRHWTGVKTTVEPSLSCGVTFYGPHWDDETRVRNITVKPRNFGPDCRNIFPSGLDVCDGYENFLGQLGRVQDLLDQTQGEYDNLAGATSPVAGVVGEARLEVSLPSGSHPTQLQQPDDAVGAETTEICHLTGPDDQVQRLITVEKDGVLQEPAIIQARHDSVATAEAPAAVADHDEDLIFFD